jgi:putative hydrolase of the HAD superfamily
MHFEHLFFDLDDTLYPSTNGLWQALRSRIDLYMIEKMHLPAEIVPELRMQLFQKHGTTLRGLEEVYRIDQQDFLDFVHHVPLKNYLAPNPQLRQTLAAYSQHKVIFTNADTNHANRVIASLGLEGVFDQIIDIRDIHPTCKPQLAAFEKALQIAGVNDAHACAMIDDTQRNLFSAKVAGFFTVLITADNCPEGIDAAIPSLQDLPDVIPVEASSPFARVG